MPFLSDEGLAAMAFDHKYASSGSSLLDGLIMQRFWNYVITLFPLQHDPKAAFHWCVVARSCVQRPCNTEAALALLCAAAPAHNQALCLECRQCGGTGTDSDAAPCISGARPTR